MVTGVIRKCVGGAKKAYRKKINVFILPQQFNNCFLKWNNEAKVLSFQL